MPNDKPRPQTDTDTRRRISSQLPGDDNRIDCLKYAMSASVDVAYHAYSRSLPSIRLRRALLHVPGVVPRVNSSSAFSLLGGRERKSLFLLRQPRQQQQLVDATNGNTHNGQGDKVNNRQATTIVPYNFTRLSSRLCGHRQTKATNTSRQFLPFSTPQTRITEDVL